MAIRCGIELGGNTPMSYVVFEPNEFVWSPYLSRRDGPYRFSFHYYDTAAPGAADDRELIAQQLCDSGIKVPRVFPRTKERGSKRVDITLATTMLTYVHRGHFDFAILVA